MKQSTKSDIFARLRNSERSFTRAERKIVNAALTDPRGFVERPMEDLVHWIGVSAPTITRFCRTIGCEGLRDLKLQIMGAIQIGTRYLDPAEPPDTIDAAREIVVARAQNAIVEAVQIDSALIEAAIEQICQAKTLYAFGSGGVSSWMVAEVQNRFFRLGLTVVPCSDGIMQTMLAATLDRSDLVVALSLGGRNTQLVGAMVVAAEYGTRTLAIAPGDSPVAAAAARTIPIGSHDDGDVLGPTGARYAMLTVIDLLAYGSALRSKDTALESLRRVKQQFARDFDDRDLRPLSD